MYKKALYSVGGGELCQASEADGVISVRIRENGRILRRYMTRPNGKIYGARAVSYADAYFEFPFATLEIMGEEKIYEHKTGYGAQTQAQND